MASESRRAPYRLLALGALQLSPLFGCADHGTQRVDQTENPHDADTTSASFVGDSATAAGPGASSGRVGDAATRDDAAGATGRPTQAVSTDGSTNAAPLDAAVRAPADGCGAGDPKLPPEPTIPPACATLTATHSVSGGGAPDESALDTAALQAALNACAPGQSLRLAPDASHNAFVIGPVTLPTGVTLWVDAGITLYGTRAPGVYGSASALISVTGENSGIVGDGIIDGQGGEPMLGQSGTWWEANAGSSGNSPALIQVRGASNFTLYRITLHNSPKFHVKLGADGFVVWGVTIKAPSKAVNTVGAALTPSAAHNTDGIDPGEAASHGFVVCSKISVGDDQMAIKGSSATGVHDLTIAHNRFGAGHGMSIGSEFTGGVRDVEIYDLSIDGTNTGLKGGSSNGIRIKSDSSRGGTVNHVSYRDVCVRNLANPILLTPHYATLTGSDIPIYTQILIQDFHALAGDLTPKVTLDGFDSTHKNSVTLDNVIVDGLSAADVAASYTTVTLGPGMVNFKPAGTEVSVTDSITGTSEPNACAGKWTVF